MGIHQQTWSFNGVKAINMVFVTQKRGFKQNNIEAATIGDINE